MYTWCARGWCVLANPAAGSDSAIHLHVCTYWGERGDIAHQFRLWTLPPMSGDAGSLPNVVGEATGVRYADIAMVGDSAWILDGCGEVVPPGDDAAPGGALARLLDMPAEQRQAPVRVRGNASLIISLSNRWH